METSWLISRARRALPTLGMLAAALLSSSCGSDTTGTDAPGFSRFSVQPQFASSMFAPVTLDRVQALVERITVDSTREGTTSDTLVNVTRNFRPTDDQLRVQLSVPLQASRETVRLTLFYYAGPTLLFVGSNDIDVGTGQSTSPEPVPMNYVGPGSNAVGLIIEPFDTTVTAGSTTPFRATAIDGQENDVGAFYMKWSLGSATSGSTIDAAGRLHAGQSGTIWVKGLLPNGVDDSVQVTITGTPGGIAIVSGNHQTGTPGSGLQSPLVVRVTTSGGAPVAGVTVTWAATIGGGDLEVTTTTTDANGESDNFATLGPNAGVNAFTATAAGAGTVTFLANENQTGSTISWIGNTSSVWSNGANWSGGVVPNVLDSVVISSTNSEFSPVLDTTPVVGALTLGGNQSLTLAAHGLGVVRNLSLLGNSILEMTDGSEAISVGGDVLFDGGNSTGHLTAGGISIAGSFTQRATNSGASYAPSGTHVMVLAGAASTVTFATPGLGANQSHFNDLAWSGQTSLTLGSNVFARVMSASFQGVATTITSTAGRTLRATEFLTPGQARLTFNNVALHLEDTTVAPFSSLSLITFQNMPTNRAQLTINYRGGTLLLNQFIFSTTPVAPNGFYIDATDTQVGDGSSLTIQVQNPTPTSMGNFFHEGGDAEIIWPFSPP